MEGGYETAASRNMELENFYVRVAELINAKPKEIAFVENATRAWDMIFYSIPLKAGDQIITVRSEYGSNVIAYLHRTKLTGAELVILENNDDGEPDIDQLKKLINKKVNFMVYKQSLKRNKMIMIEIIEDLKNMLKLLGISIQKSEN